MPLMLGSKTSKPEQGFWSGEDSSSARQGSRVRRTPAQCPARRPRLLGAGLGENSPVEGPSSGEDRPCLLGCFHAPRGVGFRDDTPYAKSGC